ncbi:MAG: glycosyltransferase family 39 protein [Anaerolineales bacterium]
MPEARPSPQTTGQSPPAAPWLERRAWLPILAVALMVRLPGLADKPLWYDEAFAILLSTKGPAAIERATLSEQAGIAADVHPLGYYLALWGWGRIFGTSPLAMRSLSVLVGLGLVAVSYFGARANLGSRLAAWFGGLLALSPFQVHYAQELRMYGLLALELTAAAVLFGSAMKQGGWLRWIGFAVLAAAAQYTHALAGLLLLPLALIPVYLRNWKAARGALLGGVMALLLYGPWLIRLPSQLGRIQEAYWITRPGLAEILRTMVIYLGGSPLPSWGVAVVLFSLVLLIGLGVWAIFSARQKRSRGWSVACGSAYLAFAPLLLMYLISLWRPVYLDRAMLPAGVAFLLLLGWLIGGDAIPERLRWTARVLVGLSFGIGLTSYWTYRGFPYAPYQEIVTFVADRKAGDEILLHSNKLTALPSYYYAPGLAQEYLADPPGSGSDTLAPATQRELELIAKPDARSAIEAGQGVWFLIFPREIGEYATLGAAEHPALAWLMANYSEDDIRSFGESELHHFQNRRAGAEG